MYARYNTATRRFKSENGEVWQTRAQYNDRFGQSDLNQEPEVPAAGQHLWDWFLDINDRISRVEDSCRRIPPSEWLAWQQMTGDIVYPWEYDILAAMDRAYCDSVDGEIAAGRALEERKP